MMLRACGLSAILLTALLSIPPPTVEASHPNSRTDALETGTRTCDTRNPYNVVKSGVAQSHFLVGLQPAGHLTLHANMTNVAAGSGIGCTLDLKVTGVQFTGPSAGGSFSKTEGSCFAIDATCPATTTIHWSINFPGTVRLRITYDLVLSTNFGDNPKHSVANVDYGDPSIPGVNLPPWGVGVPVPTIEAE